MGPVIGPGRATGPDALDADRGDCPAARETTGWPDVGGSRVVGEDSVKDINKTAVAAYRASIESGKPLSERKLAAMFGKTSRRWARSRMVEARDISNARMQTSRRAT